MDRLEGFDVNGFTASQGSNSFASYSKAQFDQTKVSLKHNLSPVAEFKVNI